MDIYTLFKNVTRVSYLNSIKFYICVCVENEIVAIQSPRLPVKSIGSSFLEDSGILVSYHPQVASGHCLANAFHYTPLATTWAMNLSAPLTQDCGRGQPIAFFSKPRVVEPLVS
ncbi:hypothetical protein RIF29_07692 [Crotalaria pallida]|uniref:Uncharacterized protein n=1 Tax=Crotalaria pallida TaxID=3830 RepID=A0AAN9J4D7_CROPI